MKTMLLTEEIYNQMQQALDAAWNNPEGAKLRAQLFPDGKPTVENFIRTISATMQQRRAD